MAQARRRRRLPNRLSEPFDALLRRMSITWETKVFNEPLLKWGLQHARYLKLWFGFGIGFGVSLMVVMSFLVPFQVFWLLLELLKKISAKKLTQGSGQVLTLMVPGVNMAWSNLPFMIAAAMIALGLHELGHAIAAASEGVPVEHVAVFLACSVPGALVALKQENLQVLSPIRALRIYCAGVWHNVMCCAGCYLILLLTQLVLSRSGGGGQNFVVAKLDENSPLAAHMQPGDHISFVGAPPLENPEDWPRALYNHKVREIAQITYTDFTDSTAQQSQTSIKYISLQGHCVHLTKFEKQESDWLDNRCSNNSILFYQHECMNTFPLTVNSLQQVRCLRAIDVVQFPLCMIRQNTSQSCSCPKNSVCLLPILSHGDGFVTIRVTRSSRKNCNVVPNDPFCKQVLVFVGDPGALGHTLQLAAQWPQASGLFKFVSIFFWHIENLLMYLFSISAAMAILNCALVFNLDGEQIFHSMLQLNESWIPTRRHRKIMRPLLIVGTILMACLVIFSFIGLIT